MSEEIKVTITEQIEKINLTITESPKILVNVLNVATVDPSVANARNTAEAAAESASTSAEVAMTVLQQAQDIADTLPTMVGDEVTTQLGALTTDNLVEGANNLYFTDARVESTVNALTTDSLPEGANNLYFTNARALSAAQESLNLKAPLASPVFTGEPEVPTVASALDSSGKIASTGFVQAVALNKVAGPESSTGNTLPRFDGETGKIVKGSGIEVDDADNVSGINALTTDSVNLDKLSISEVVNSALTGQNATLAVDSSKIILTNASLVSIESITSSLANISCTIVNRTGNAIMLLNNIGANGIILPNAKDLKIDIDSSVRVMKSAEAGNKFIIDGGAGSGSGGGQTLSTLMQLTADESLSDWTFLNDDLSISKVDPLFGDASYELGMTNLAAATYKVIPADIGFRGTTIALTLNYLMPQGAARVELLDQDNVLIDGATFDIPAANGKEKFGTTVFIPSDVTGIRFKAESRATVAGQVFKFDNVQLSADLLKSVDVSDLVQSEILVNVGNLSETTDLSTFSSIKASSNALLYSKSASGVTFLREAEVTIVYSGLAGASNARAVRIYLNGVLRAGSNAANIATGVAVLNFKADVGDKVTFVGVSFSTESNVQITATARTKSIVAPTDQVTEKSIAFKYANASEYTPVTLPNAPDGTYITFKSTGATYVQTTGAERPTQTDADMSVNGIFVTPTTYTANSSSATPSKFMVKLPRGMVADFIAYKDTSKSAYSKSLGLGYHNANATQLGLTACWLDPDTGIMTIDWKALGSSQTALQLIMSDRSFHGTATYICFTASKLAQGVAIPTPARYVVKTYQSGTSWYEVYNDGWVEQRQISVTGSGTTITLSPLIPFKDSYATAITDRLSGFWFLAPNNSSSTTVTFTTLGNSGSAVGAGVPFSWIVKGYGDSATVKSHGANPNY